ncbi:hypothetical protein CN203_11560 [Sinorhizobium meliloti]|uniref:hypothetical protein n=1 Tax=Rhizobium meliloti TaxID=382 RepID=UPI0002D5AB52|nr:hypothetical protein [Sinorhizobium meliloti]RVH78125.1 hypothetical protein CN203_11560 [Sinorhizobium meliloti]
MIHLLEDSPESLAELIAFVDSSLLQLALELQMRHWLPGAVEPMPQASIAMWAYIDMDGELGVRLSFGDVVELPNEAEKDGLFHAFGSSPLYAELSLAVQELIHHWGSQSTLVGMLRAAHPRLIAERNGLVGAVA